MTARPQSPLAKPLILDAVQLDYRDTRGGASRALDIGALTVAPGFSLGVTGPSGCGKSSLLMVIAGIEPVTSGHVSWGGTDIARLSQSERDRWRRDTVGLVFQNFHLIPELSARANVALPLGFGRPVPVDLPGRMQVLFATLDIDFLDRRAAGLSRGQQQRLAIARALLFKPALILADEPTASLDAANAARVGELLVELARKGGATLIVASHDRALLARLDEVCMLEAGRIVNRGKPAP